MSEAAKKIPLGLLLIGTMKLVVAALLAGAAFGVFKLLDRNISEFLQQVIILLHLDPHNHFLNTALEKISGVDHRQLKQIGAATMIYALLYAIEGTGLLLRKHWAEYLVIIITGSLLPLECYEIVEKIGPVRIGMLVINFLILLYLVWRLRKDRQIAVIKT